MEEKMNIKATNRILYIGIIALITCLIFFVYKYIGLGNFIEKIIRSLIPVFIAIFISFILEPVVKMFIKRGIKRKYSVILTYLIFAFLIGIVLYFTIPVFVKQIDVFISNIPTLTATVNDFLKKIGISSNIGSSFSSLIINISSNILSIL